MGFSPQCPIQQVHGCRRPEAHHQPEKVPSCGDTGVSLGGPGGLELKSSSVPHLGQADTSPSGLSFLDCKMGVMIILAPKHEM